MTDIIETIELDDKTDFELWYDIDNSHFYDDLWQDEISFISNHRDYKSQGVFTDIDEIENINNDEYSVLPVSAYIHSGISISLSNNSYPFNCPWDSGMFGYLIFKKGTFGEKDIGLKGFISSWNALLNNEVYGFSIINKIKCEHCGDVERQIDDSMGGFYGYEDREELLKSIKENIDLPDNLLNKIK